MPIECAAIWTRPTALFFPANCCSIWPPPGMLREDAYRLVQAHAMHAWQTEGDFRSQFNKIPEIRRYLDEEQLERASRWSANWKTSTPSFAGFSNRILSTIIEIAYGYFRQFSFKL